MNINNSDHCKQWFDMISSFYVGFHPLDKERRFLTLRFATPILLRGTNTREHLLMAYNEILFKFRCFLNLMMIMLTPQEISAFFGDPSPFGHENPRGILQFLSNNVSKTCVHECQIPKLAGMCGDVLRGTSPGARYMRFPAPYLLTEEQKKEFHVDWYYPVVFRYEDYTSAQLNPWASTDIEYPIVYRDLRYKKTFYLILDIHKMSSYFHVNRQEQKRKRWLADRNIAFLRGPYQCLTNLRPHECFITWQQWVEYLLQYAGTDTPKVVISPPLCCDCH